jgi:hypothetical protein
MRFFIEPRNLIRWEYPIPADYAVDVAKEETSLAEYIATDAEISSSRARWVYILCAGINQLSIYIEPQTISR